MIEPRAKAVPLFATAMFWTFPAQAHPTAGATGSSEWFWFLLTVGLLLVAGQAYVLGWRKLSRRVRHGPIGRGRAWAFAGGWIVAAIALLSPIDAWSKELFAAHMVQHELLMLASAPLLAFSRPAVVMLWSLPRTPRKALGRMLASGIWYRIREVAAHPVTAWSVYAIVLWIWHVPALFEAALNNDIVHAVQHLSFLGAALLFWGVFLEPDRACARDGTAVLANFTTAVHASILGAAFTFSPAAWYLPYHLTAHDWGLTPLEDQQLGGLMMWVPGGIVHTLAALFALAPRLLHENGRRSNISREEAR